MKKVAINPRKYYSSPTRNYTAGEILAVEDSVAEELQEQGIATVSGTINEPLHEEEAQEENQ